jgi:hypothetical protein
MSYPGTPGGEPQPGYAYPDGVGYPPPQPQPPMQPPPQQYAPVEQPGFAPGSAPVGYPADYGYAPQPGMPPTAAMPPISGAPPMSGPPMSGAPMSGVPVSGYPSGPAPAPARRGAAVPVLAGLAALLLLAAGVMTALYITKNNALSSSKKTVAARNTTISDRDAQVKKLQSDLQAKSDELDKARQDLTGSQNQTQELKKEKDTIKQCITLLGEAGDLRDKGDNAGAQAKEAQAKPICDQAFIYLGT